MAIDIPSYYYTDIYKRTTIDVNFLKNFNPEIPERKSLADTLSISELNKTPTPSDVEIKGIETPDLTKGGPIIVTNKEGNPLAYYDFKNCINSMGLDDDQKTTLINSVITSTESVYDGIDNGDTVGMTIAQTNMELKYISSKLVPDQFQDQFNAIADQYTQSLSDKYTKFMEDMDTDIMNRTDPTTIATGWNKRAKEDLDSIKNGTDIFHTTEAYYDTLYNSIDLTNDDTIKKSLSSVYDKFMDSSSDSSFVDEAKFLSDKWNAVIDSLNAPSSLKFTTSVNCLA